MRNDPVPSIFGYRKLIVCVIAMICIVALIYFNMPHTENGITAVVTIAGVYCGINIYKESSSLAMNQLQDANEQMFSQMKMQNDVLSVMATATDPSERKTLMMAMRAPQEDTADASKAL